MCQLSSLPTDPQVGGEGPRVEGQEVQEGKEHREGHGVREAVVPVLTEGRGQEEVSDP